MYRMNTGYTVADAMTREPITVTSDKSLKEAARVMSDMHVGALLVKDGDKLMGIMSEQDIVRKAVVAGEDPTKTKVSEVMERNLVTISPEEDIFEALRIMREENFRHLPVMHEGKFVGLVTMKDVLRIEPDLYEILVEKIELREHERKPLKKLS